MIDTGDVRPINGFVLLEFHNVPKYIDVGFGVLAPGDAAESIHWRVAEVIAVDPLGFMNKQMVRSPHIVKRGDLVVIERIFGDVVVDDHVRAMRYRVVSEDQISGIIEGVSADDWWEHLR